MRRFNRLPDMPRADVDLLAVNGVNYILAMLVQAHAQQGDTVDEICQRYYGRTGQAVELVYAANPGRPGLAA